MSTADISEALRKTGAAFAADPGKAHAIGSPATARLVEGLRFEVTGPNGELAYTDMAPSMGGAASAPPPGWFLRGAIASCTATVIAMRAARTGVHLTTLDVSVESEADQRGMLGLGENVSAAFSALRVRVRIGADDATPDRLRALASWGDAHSPVACTVRESPPASIDVEIV